MASAAEPASMATLTSCRGRAPSYTTSAPVAAAKRLRISASGVRTVRTTTRSPRRVTSTWDCEGAATSDNARASLRRMPPPRYHRRAGAPGPPPRGVPPPSLEVAGHVHDEVGRARGRRAVGREAAARSQPQHRVVRARLAGREVDDAGSRAGARPSPRGAGSRAWSSPVTVTLTAIARAPAEMPQAPRTSNVPLAPAASAGPPRGPAAPPRVDEAAGGER